MRKKIYLSLFLLILSSSVLGCTQKTAEIPPRPEATITLVEGWDNERIADYLDAQNVIDKASFIKAAEGKEGYLFPDTYQVFLDDTAENLVQKFTDNFQNKVNSELQAEIERQAKTVKQIVILASIIEKEAPNDAERAHISGVFWNRLNIDYPLQSDATVPKYNSYDNLGLPPEPICNPGLASIRAAIYPEKTEDWFFLTTPEGGVVYAETFNEHKKNIVKYYSE